MKPSSKARVTDEVDNLPKARIDALDSTYILPLREFLSTQGCDVSVNDRTVRECEYHIIVGDRNFVKRIVENTTFTTKKILIITWEMFDDLNLVRIPIKIAVVDSSPLTEKEIKKIFSFFITGHQKKLIVQTEQKFTNTKEEKDSPSPLSEKSPNSRENQFPNLPWRTVLNQTAEQQHVSDETRISSVIENVYAEPTKTPRRTKSFWTLRRLTMATITTTLFLFIFPFFWYAIMTIATGLSFLRLATCLEKGNIPCANVSFTVATQANAQRELMTGIVHPFISLTFGKDTVFTYERIGVLFRSMLELAKEANSGTGLMTEASAFFYPDISEAKTSAVLVDLLKKIMPSVRTNLDLSIGSAVILSSSDIFPFTIPIVHTTVETVTQKMKTYRKIVNMAEQGISLYPVFAGFKGTQKILFLFENNSELRPTGGFIGSIARGDITDGKLNSFQIHDVYTFDGQLKGHVDPPQTLRDAWGQEHWYLRDSNWHPDFRESARSAMWFFEKETGERVNSVIAITTSFIVRLLAVTGPIDLPGYNDRITSDNFYAKSLFYTQTDFFPGSTQKKDFLSTLTEALLAKLQAGKQSYALGIARTITESLLSRDILLFVSDPIYETAIIGMGWGGNVPAVSSCPEAEIHNGKSCMVSSVAINEANISVNKVNSFIRRTQNRLVTINQTGTISEKITRAISNDSRGEPGSGPYTSYIRFMVPNGMNVTGFTIDGVPVPTRIQKAKKQTLPYGELDTSIPGLTTIAVALTIPPMESKTITLSFEYQVIFPQDNATTIVFTDQKQPGVDSVPSQFQLFTPKNIHVNASESGVPILAKSGGFEYNNSLTSDTEIRVYITKNP